MKKLVSLIGVIAILLTMSVSVFAGDVPECLLNEDTAKVFIGTVESYTTKDIPSGPYTVIDTVEVIPTEKIKGDVEIGVKETYSDNHSSLDLEPNTEYLFGYFGENNFSIYEIESREDKKFKLVNSDKYNMTKRLEDYLNDGSFEKAENERLKKIEQSTKSNASSTSIIGGADESTDIVVKSNTNIWAAVGIGTLVLALVVLLVVKKKR